MGDFNNRENTNAPIEAAGGHHFRTGEVLRYAAVRGRLANFIFGWWIGVKEELVALMERSGQSWDWVKSQECSFIHLVAKSRTGRHTASVRTEAGLAQVAQGIVNHEAATACLPFASQAANPGNHTRATRPCEIFRRTKGRADEVCRVAAGHKFHHWLNNAFQL